MDDFILVLEDDLYNQLLAMAEDVSYLKFAISKLVFEQTKDGWIADVSRLNYCMLLIMVQTVSKKSALAKRLIALGRAQDGNFDPYLAGVKKDLDRFCPDAEPRT